MRAVIQRVISSSVTVDGKVVSEIGPGLLVCWAWARGTPRRTCDWMVEKLATLRIFEDAAGKMNLSLQDTQSSSSS